MAFDTRTEKNISTLVPKAQEHARLFVQAVLDKGISIRIIDGSRSFKEQGVLFNIGRFGDTRPIVTKAPPGFSNHNFGIAWDIGVFEGNKFIPESPLYKQAGKIGTEMGLEWGGNFTSITDEPHFQCKTGKKVSQLRAIVLENGGDISKPDAKTAINNLVLPLNSGHVLPDLPTSVPIQVLRKTKIIDLDAFLLESRVWVSLNDFIDFFGGNIVTITGTPPVVIIHIESESIGMTGMRVNDRIFVKFADINTFFDFTFKFDGANKRLTLL
jgi:hypothetical protein